MTIREDVIREALRAQAQALRVPDRPALDGDTVELRRSVRPRLLIAAACFALVVACVVVLTQRRPGDHSPAPPVAPVTTDTAAPAPSVVPVVTDGTAPATVVNGWVALDSGRPGGGAIYLARSGEDARRLEVAGWETADEACPAWSPDGTRLLFGRVAGSSDSTFSGAELVIVPVSPDGAIGAPTVIALDGFRALDGFDPYPCAIWAPDGRWVALGGGGEVRVVDTQTEEIRHLAGLRPSDLEWRPGTDELVITGDMGANRAAPTLSSPVMVYSVSTGVLRQLGSVEAAHVTWSPDGSTLAYQGGEDSPNELWLVDADGADERLLVADIGEANHGIGPVWSPNGDRIAYQRLDGVSSENHVVVLVSVADGVQRVIEPPETDGVSGRAQWYPDTVTWSPDGTTLLYSGWSLGAGSVGGVIAVPADTPSDVTILTDAIGSGSNYGHRWATQRWGRQPG